MYDTLVIGLGSPLMGDDGLGLVAVASVEERWDFTPHVEFVDGGTWGMNLLHLIEGAEAMILVDAIDAGVNPGSIVVLEREELPKFLSMKLSPHQIDLKEVLALAVFRDTLPNRTVAIGLQPGRVEMTSELSDEVATGMNALCQSIVNRLTSWGHSATLAQADANA